MQVNVQEWMQTSGVGFGTSGARGLVSAMTDQVCYAYTHAFLAHCEKEYAPIGAEALAKKVAIAGDLRPSTGRILGAVAKAAADMDWEVIYAGRIPSPAIALYGIVNRLPTVMVTGSHIPDDRNGIKFNHPFGEITKRDEAGIVSQIFEIDESLFDANGMLKEAVELPTVEKAAEQIYTNRYIQFFGTNALRGMRLGVYEHSAVGRDILVSVVEALGGTVTRLGRSDVFIPVDTEAIREEDKRLAADWIRLGLDAILSTDGDSDRPLLSNEKGEWWRGDVLGILAANALKIKRIATPVSCNTALEKSGLFEKTLRTRIGSPYVIEGMERLADDACTTVAGYEANGGFLLQTNLNLDFAGEARFLQALPTRDALLPILAVLVFANQKKCSLSALEKILPLRFTASDRLKNFPTAKSKEKIAAIQNENSGEALFGKWSGHLTQVDLTDGYRMTFDSDEIIHLRPSGNAPELRCYVETATAKRSEELLRLCLSEMETWRGE